MGKIRIQRTSLINDSGVRKNVSRHIAVLSAHKGFDNNPERKYVNHKDCVPGNDILTNLEWCTHEENMRHALGKPSDGDALSTFGCLEYNNW